MVRLNQLLVARFCGVLVATAMVSFAGAAKAGPDVDGAVDALISWPAETAGDFVGSAGLITSSLGGALGDGIACIDDNEYTRVVLRGFLSTTVRRMFYGLSTPSTGALEGLRAENLRNYPESSGAFLDPDGLSGRIDSFEAGLGGVYVMAIDALTGPVLLFTRAVGLPGAADDVAEFKDSRRERYFGPLAK
jgi:hypothetical protein